jgi:NADH:ubiquinone oxidoreductase subunit C
MDLEPIFETARLLIEEWAEKVETPAPNRLDFSMKKVQDLVPAVAGLRVKRLGYLSCITGLDLGTASPNLEVLYHFCTGPAIITLRFLVPKSDGMIPSLTQIIPSAESFERELSEMFGIEITGLRNKDYLYLPDDWQPGQYPLRKDFDPSQISEPN